ncbi:sensor histidine kinase [Spirillospora albida]|uniref:sensor histidine kinase n=1 Tax=Spirillospora albida TaxID=58123 RepID=UPI00068FAB2D|nr:HAMP domain-containing sensor histidine kinase [Spirillospora albida]
MTVLAGAVTAVICAVLSVLIIVGARGQVADHRRDQATAAALRLVYEVKRSRVPAVLSGPEATVLQVLNARGHVVAGSRNAPDTPIATFLPEEGSVYEMRTLCPPKGLSDCMWVIAFRVFEPDGDWTVYAAAERIPWYVSGALCLFLLGASLLIVLLAALRTWRTVDRTLAPVDAIRAELAEITASRSGRRVPVPETRDEIRALAEAANATLDRLDAELERQRRFTSDASHDLRSPIAAARAQLEEALMYPLEADWPRTGRGVLQSLDRLQAIVTDLLELARLDAGRYHGDETIDLSALVTIEIRRSERTKRIVTTLAEGVTVRGDRLRLVRLLTNLLDNAERHADSRIDVSVRAEDGYAVLEVLDDGAGIPERQRDLVFQRFARLKEAEDKDAGGTGLGLPIAREIATSHGGTLTIEDSDHGARFVLRLPLERSERTPGRTAKAVRART